jgi:integrase
MEGIFKTHLFAKNKHRKIKYRHENIIFNRFTGHNQKTLRKAELKQLLDVISSRSRYPLRDSTMLLFTRLCGLRVGEVVALRFDDILDANGNVRDEMTLDAARTK